MVLQFSFHFDFQCTSFHIHIQMTSRNNVRIHLILEDQSLVALFDTGLKKVFEACCHTVLPDWSISIGQKLVKNSKNEKF